MEALVASWLATLPVAVATSSSGMHRELRDGATMPGDFFLFMEPRDTSVIL